MKALVKREAKKGIWMEDVPEPEVGMNDVLIKVLKTAICGTDLHIYLWNEWAAKTIPVPMVIGHEFVGEIIEVGDNVNDFHPGQIVSGEGHVVCGRCRNCMAGRRHLCAHTSGIGVNRPGAFAEYISLPMSNVWEHRKGIDLDIASIFDPYGNAVHTALQFEARSAVLRRQSASTRARATWSSPTSATTAWGWPKNWAPRAPSTSPVSRWRTCRKNCT
jgi:threonine 3-dehydrogenase